MVSLISRIFLNNNSEEMIIECGLFLNTSQIFTQFSTSACVGGTEGKRRVPVLPQTSLGSAH